jgi:hypothetical protein
MRYLGNALLDFRSMICSGGSVTWGSWSGARMMTSGSRRAMPLDARGILGMR